jgi:hypothetical protein
VFCAEVVDMDELNESSLEPVAYIKRTETFHWCGECQQAFPEDHPDFDFSLCPLCKTDPQAGFLPWTWLRTHWKDGLPSVPEPGVLYEFHPETGTDGLTLQ